MAEVAGVVELDKTQVKTAVQCLLAYLKTTSPNEATLLNEGQRISLLLTFWKIPKREQTIRIPLPHSIRTDWGEVCLFTRNEPNMTSDQNVRFYKTLLKEKGIKGVSEVIPFKVLVTEYKSFESKRKLLRNFDLFLTDNRIRRKLPPIIGKHFFESKKVPLSVNLLSQQLAKTMEQLIQGSTFRVSKKGSCCMVHVAHSLMTADQVVENIMAAVKTITSQLPQKGKDVKIIHLKSQTSAALPVYTSDLSHLSLLEEARQAASLKKGADKSKKMGKAVKRKDTAATQQESLGEEEEIPQLVPIELPNKKARLQVAQDMGPEKVTGKMREGSETPEEEPHRKGLKLTTPSKTRAATGTKKLVKSAKKCSKTPEKSLRRRVPQSC
ncbi:ribosomal L1 domain-containing protein 1 [Brienomyrus brachyistius]|uniref:ribosomal L1 domain-containing protein 1 n=1 Tax=Brienomyrus brachyistius TaxID=42636 RepID=UPI0020B1A203|nr:ribosomal L1 domain-containing protein 1 [Brienomyrus brachyistius]